MARIVVAGAGAVGASLAYHLALKGERDIVLAARGQVAGGSTGKAMGGVRQQFSTAPEVRLAQASIGFFEELGPPFFDQVGYLFLAATSAGLEELEARRQLQAGLGVPVEHAQPSSVLPGLRTDDVLGAVWCAADGVADPPAVTRELVRRATELGVAVREGTDAREVDGEVLVIACGPHSPELGAERGVELPIRPLCRQLVETTPVDRLPQRLPMTIEAETGFHFRRVGERLRLAMVEKQARWGFEESVDWQLAADWLRRLHHRFPPAVDAEIATAWAGLYDMTPDAHPIIGRVAEGVYAACGFSGHGFMQSPAVGQALAEEIVDGRSEFDLSPFRLERFEAGASFPETLVL
jgi:glycine/D-amino acid oxidase-like deaminating enzyme